MSEFKLPHVEDFRTDSTLTRYLTENAKAIEQEDHDDDQALSDEVADRKEGDDAEKAARQSTDNDLEKRIKKLEDNSATHDDVTAARDFMNDKAERVVLGTDLSTVKRAVEMILKNEGVI
ncbi:hypothetical protein [Limosilactobacillus reuteri]|uniref:hypothetical protein n=1 Tax=Limosilactobacillus reuteri TaxID=1598 RepID=UPI0024BB5519|nr:hypothetical protein [Limosilactobacillus reuteri]